MKNRLDIDLIPESLYQDILNEFKQQFGEGIYDEWEITAVTNKDCLCNCGAPIIGPIEGICGNCYKTL